MKIYPLKRRRFNSHLLIKEQPRLYSVKNQNNYSRKKKDTMKIKAKIKAHRNKTKNIDTDHF